MGNREKRVLQAEDTVPRARALHLEGMKWMERRLWGWCKKRLGTGETWLGEVVFTLRMKIWAFVPMQWGTAEG